MARVYKEVLRYLEPPKVYKISPLRQFWLAGPQLELISNWSSPYFGEWVIWGNFYIRASSYREGGGFFQAKKKKRPQWLGRSVWAAQVVLLCSRSGYLGELKTRMFRVFFSANKDHDGQIVVFIRHMWSLFFKRRRVSWGECCV